jgi:ketosteroid isomerase-like protein
MTTGGSGSAEATAWQYHVIAEHEALLRRTYAAFNARDIDAVLATMHPDVDWPNAWEGGRLRGRSEVRDYWRRQFAAIDSRVEPTHFATDPDARVVVDVHQVVRDLDGKLLSDGHVQHCYTFRDGLVLRMDVRES